MDLWISVTRPYGSLTDLADDARPGSGPSLGIDLRLSPNTHSTMLLVTAGVHALSSVDRPPQAMAPTVSYLDCGPSRVSA